MSLQKPTMKENAGKFLKFILMLPVILCSKSEYWNVDRLMQEKNNRVSEEKVEKQTENCPFSIWFGFFSHSVFERS